MKQDRAVVLRVLALLGILYGIAALPFAYFRHDDWWILGNSAISLPQDWGFLWSPTLYFDAQPLRWFFRPGFKLGVWAFHHLFAMQYWLWLSTLLAGFLAAVWLGYLTVERLAGSRNGLWFATALAASVTVHFGSLVWAGEGMMNVPQLALLMGSTYCFVRNRQTPAWGWSMASVLAFVLALGFKESTVFHPGFLFALVWVETGPGALGRAGIVNRSLFCLRACAAFFVVGLGYTAVRLGAMPVNPSYLPAWEVTPVLRSLAVALSPLLLPLALWIVFLRLTHRSSVKAYLRAVADRAVFLPFLIASLSVYLGHSFFSPGWYLVVGVFTLLALSTVPLPKVVTRKELLAFGAVLFFFSGAPVASRLVSMGWWQWHHAQKGVYQAVKGASPAVRLLTVRACENPAYPGVDFTRVVANEEGLRQMWELVHGTKIPVQVIHCGADWGKEPGEMVLDWRFPEVGRVIASP